MIAPTQFHKTWILGEEVLGQLKDRPLINVFQEHFFALKSLIILNRFPTKPFCRPTAFPRICRDMHSQAHF
jgi:hypothetical protein